MIAAVMAAAAFAGEAAGQRARVHDTPARPALWAGADTNSAAAYYGHGVQKLSSAPDEAAAAFYWASRLNPGWADPLYGRRVALLMSDPRRLVNYMDGSRQTLRNPEIQAIDSLQLRALALDPFVLQKFDRQMILRYLETVYAQYFNSVGETDRTLASFEAQQALNHASPFFRAWMAYSEGRFPAALEEYEKELRRARRKARLRADVARINFLSGNHARAVEQFTLAIDELRKEEDRDLVFVYESKAILEYSLASIHRRAGNADAAREALGRALQEDLAFAPAHIALSELALAAGDTATALAEMALAADVRPEPATLYSHAVLLLRASQPLEAAAALKRAVEMEPYFAAPYFLLAGLYDHSDMDDQALEHFRLFLARASRDDPYRARAAARAAELEAAARAAGGGSQ